MGVIFSFVGHYVFLQSNKVRIGVVRCLNVASNKDYHYDQNHSAAQEPA